MSDITSTPGIASAALAGAQRFGLAALKQAAQQEQAAVELARQAVEEEKPVESEPESRSGEHAVDVLV